jgi:hypothetical protein
MNYEVIAELDDEIFVLDEDAEVGADREIDGRLVKMRRSTTADDGRVRYHLTTDDLRRLIQTRGAEIGLCPDRWDEQPVAPIRSR